MLHEVYVVGDGLKLQLEQSGDTVVQLFKKSSTMGGPVITTLEMFLFLLQVELSFPALLTRSYLCTIRA